LENPLFSLAERRLLAGLALVTAASWGRFFATGSLKVDESYPGRVAGYALLAVLVVGWALSVRGWTGVLDAPPARPRRLAYVALAVVSAMLPLLSNDVFSVMAYGTGAAEGHDVYRTTDWLPATSFFPWLGQHWNATVCVYGPGTLIAALPAALARGNPWLGLFVLRLSWLLPVVGAMEVVFRLFHDRPVFHAMVWLNPLWLVEGPGQLHGDLIGLAALALGVALHASGRVKSGAALWALAFWSKYSFLFGGLWFWLARSEGQRIRRAATMAAIAGGVGVALYAPFWRGWETITKPLVALGTMNPGGSLTEVGGILVQFVLHAGAVTPPDMPVHAALALDRVEKGQAWKFMWVLLAPLSWSLMGSAIASLRKRRDDEHLGLVTGIVTVAFLTIASRRFQCWYLLAALPFFGLATTQAWKRWWVAIVLVAVPVDFNCVLERTSPVYPVWGALTTGAQVVLFLAWLKSRYWAPELLGPGDAPPGATAPAAPSSPQAGS
jgi:hypothetical protein